MTSTTDPQSIYQRAHQLRERVEFEQARAHYGEFLSAYGPGARGKSVLKALIGQIHCANALEDWREMEALSRRVVDAYPDSPAGPLHLGEALIRLQRHDEA